MNDLSNYQQLNNGIIKQLNVNKITYNYDYSNIYNNNIYKESSIAFSHLRLGILLGILGKTPNSILDVGYGNGDFLKIASKVIPNCYGSDISDYPVPINCTKIDLFEKKHYDVICFFDSLEHFDDINIIKDLDTEYIFISVPWCHNFNDNWFKNWYHLKPNEHLWHFNKDALLTFFNQCGYDCIYSSNYEDIVRVNNKSKNYPNILSCMFKKINNINTQISNYYENKTIVVTGGTGFIGRNIVNELLNYNIKQIIIFDRTLKYSWKSDKIIYIQGNLLTDLDKLSKYKFDIVFHQAANVDTTDMNEELMINTNYTSFIKLIKLCEINSAKLIYASSASIYGNSSAPNIVNESEDPLNVYGKSKLMMDNYLRDNLSNLSITIIGLRYFNVYGNGENHKQKMKSMICQMIDSIKNNDDVNLFEFGEQERDFVYIKDVVRCNLLAGLNSESNIYNCGSGKSVSFNEIFDIIKSYYPNNSKINYIKNIFVFYQIKTLADIKLTETNLTYQPYYDIKKGIFDFISNI
jgi:ADP-L-glycero-D-manno-heptose 6-epimerase